MSMQSKRTAEATTTANANAAAAAEATAAAAEATAAEAEATAAEAEAAAAPSVEGPMGRNSNRELRAEGNAPRNNLPSFRAVSAAVSTDSGKLSQSCSTEE